MVARLVEGRPYLPAVDGLRAVAVLAVMAFHLVPSALRGGFAGVDVFFVISGFVVTGSMRRDAGLPLGRFLLAFYARRFRRIVPALTVCLLVSVLFSAAFIPDAWLSHALRDTALHAFFGVSNFALIASSDGYFAARSEFNPFTHTWSLAVEEQFYLLFPLLAYFMLAGQQHRAARWAARMFWSLCAASLAWCAYASLESKDHAYYMLPSRLWELGLGAAAGVMTAEQRASFTARVGGPWLSAVGVALIAFTLVVADSGAFPFPWALPAALGTFFVIVAAAAGPARTGLERVLASAPMVAVGLLSYSLYLWHWPVYTLMRWTVGLESVATCAVALLLSGALAMVSYRWVEQPTQRWPWLKRAPAAAVVGLGALSVLVGWLAAAQVYARPQWFKHTVVEASRADWYPTPAAMPDEPLGEQLCEVAVQRPGNDVTVFKPQRCGSAVVPARPVLFVAGDSHAGAYARMLQRASMGLGLEVRRYGKGGCPVAGLMRPLAEEDAACRVHVQWLLADILQRAQPGDLVFLAALRVPRISETWGAVIPPSPLAPPGAPAAAVARRAAEAEAAAVLDRLAQAGLRVILDLPKPVFPAPPFRCADSFNRDNPVCAGGFAVSRSFALAHRRDVVDALARLAQGRPSLHLWDPLPALCAADACNAFDGQRPVFFDADHLSGHGNELLVPSFNGLLRGLLADTRGAPAPAR